MNAEPLAELVAVEARLQRFARGRRDDLIRQMRAEGASFRAIARAAGMSVHAIERIVSADTGAGEAGEAGGR